MTFTPAVHATATTDKGDDMIDDYPGERRWKARSDLRTMSEAREIEQDPARRRAAISEGERQVREAEERVKEARTKAAAMSGKDDMFKGYTSLGKMDLGE